MCRGLSAYSTTGAQVSRPWFLSLLATLYGKIGEWEKAQQSLSDAMMEMSGMGSRFYEAEVYRLRGALVLASPLDDHPEVASCFQQAIAIAQRQQAKSLELRAATSLAKLWQSQGKRQEAYDLLAPVYTWFTEGFDTMDLQDAKALLDDLSQTVERSAKRHTDGHRCGPCQGAARRSEASRSVPPDLVARGLAPSQPL
jgi:predicted ATPase